MFAAGAVVTERATMLQVIPGMDAPFESISFAYEPGDDRSVSVTMHGTRSLRLRFTSVIALRFEDDCPGFDPLPRPLPMLRPGMTFPLLKVEESSWLNQWHPVHQNLAHFVLLSLDDLVQLIASPTFDVI
jgi:hypothetical protein